MALFSQRQGIRPLQKAIQRKSIDNDLRSKLWSATARTTFDNYSPPQGYDGYLTPETKEVLQLVEVIWVYFFKWPIDAVPEFRTGGNRSAYDIIRDQFFKADWSRVYDFIEFLAKNAPPQWAARLREQANKYLESESAAYRFVGVEIVEITDKNEVEAIETALEGRSKATRQHLKTALELISDRHKPDLRNSIKESISAVEATCQTMAGDSKATLGDALKTLKAGAPLHGAFEQALLKLYGYTSDEGGIRHSLNDLSESPTYADAKFMLVACSAFINYLWTKAAESELKIKSD